MNNFLGNLKTGFFSLGYKFVAKPVFFAQDPEKVHDKMTALGQKLGKFGVAKTVLRLCFDYKNPILESNILGLKFQNPIGLAAGFDKDAEMTDTLPSVGFGFMEAGSITGKFCEGNPKPRLWRLPKSNSLVVHYGLRNKGCDEIVDRLRLKKENKKFEIPLGLSVAMTNNLENGNVENAISDYCHAFDRAREVADYITVNISCPNITCDEKMFLDPINLEKLLIEIDKISYDGPVFVKMSPDLDTPALDEILKVLLSHKIHGIICTNLTKKRDTNLIIEKDIPEKGGLSGKAVSELSDKMISYIFKNYGEKFVVIGCGGIFSAADAYKKIRLGASVVQMFTGMIFQGPQTIGKINRKLAVLIKKDGFKSISEVIGIDSF